MDALTSTGPAELPTLSDGQCAELPQELARGPAVHGWEDQRWTLARVRTLIAWKFHLECWAAAMWRRMHGHDWSSQPAHVVPIPGARLTDSMCSPRRSTPPRRSRRYPAPYRFIRCARQ
jgi:hypothetical protein